MAPHENAGKPAPKSSLIDVDALVSEYYARVPDLQSPGERVSFGTSGHRGSAFDGSFNERHILAITQAIVEYRVQAGTTGPLYLARDTHALSGPAFRSALRVFARAGVQVMVDAADGYTPTPVLSHAILTHNRGRDSRLADGVVITPSHNPPRDGGFKYNPTHGGPAETSITQWIENRANEILADERQVGLPSEAQAAQAANVTRFDFVAPYVEDLATAIDFDVIRSTKIRIGADPMGGAGVGYWRPIADKYRIDIHVTNDSVDPTFSFMTLDSDGQIRMDCSSAYAMQRLIALSEDFAVAFGNDPDFDRHGIVTPKGGLLNPNHYLAVAIDYLLKHRPDIPATSAIGKTAVSSSLIDRVVLSHGRKLVEVPVGFKWFVPGLLRGELAFAGEESAGASFIKRDGKVWTTDKDGILLGLLAAEITARTGDDLSSYYRSLTQAHGEPIYARIDRSSNAAEMSKLGGLTEAAVHESEVAGDSIVSKSTRASGNDQPLGGLKVQTDKGWFAVRPSGTEHKYKIYAESFVDRQHLERIQQEAQAIVDRIIR
jgi:phosphoglucomutase